MDEPSSHRSRITPSVAAYEQRIKELTKEISQKSREIFGTEAMPVMSFELEATAVLKGGRDTFPFKEAPGTRTLLMDRKAFYRLNPVERAREDLRKARAHREIPDPVDTAPEMALFEGSAFIARAMTELDFTQPSPQDGIMGAGTCMTDDGRQARPIEIISNFSVPRQGPGSTFKSGTPNFSPLVMARAMRSLPKTMAAEAKKYGLERIDLGTRPMKGEWDQTNSLHVHINLLAKDGANLFKDGDEPNAMRSGETQGKCSKLHLCFLKENLEFDRDGMLLYAPREEDYARFRNFSAPLCHRVFPHKTVGGMGTILIRGDGRRCHRPEDHSTKAIADKGELRTEHRLPCPTAITANPDEQGYLFVETFLIKMSRALDRYKRMKEAGTLDTLTEGSILGESYPIASSLEEAKQRFTESPLMHEIYGDRMDDISKVADRAPAEYTDKAFYRT